MKSRAQRSCQSLRVRGSPTRTLRADANERVAGGAVSRVSLQPCGGDLGPEVLIPPPTRQPWLALHPHSSPPAGGPSLPLAAILKGRSRWLESRKKSQRASNVELNCPGLMGSIYCGSVVLSPLGWPDSLARKAGRHPTTQEHPHQGSFCVCSPEGLHLQ